MRLICLPILLGIAACGGSSTTTTNKDMTLTDQLPVTISGVVEQAALSNNTPLAGATVTVVGTTNSTTSASDGTFSLTVNSNQTIFLNASSTGDYSVMQGVVVTGAVTDISLSLIPTALVMQVEASLSPTISLDSTKGVVNVNFNFENGDGGSVPAVTGIGATLSASHGNPFAVTNSGATYSSVTTSGGNSLIFPNVTAGTTTVTVTPPSGTTCTPAEAITNYTVAANTFTDVNFNCN